MFGLFKKRAAFSAMDTLSPWLYQIGLDRGTARFSTYEDKDLMATKKADLIVIGIATRFTGERVGFFVELNQVTLFVKKTLESGVASWHHAAAQDARSLNISLFEALSAREAAFTQKQLDIVRQATDTREAIEHLFLAKGGDFCALDQRVQETILLEVAMFRRLERTAEMFYETVEQIASKLSTFEDKRHELIEAWSARGELLRAEAGV